MITVKHHESLIQQIQDLSELELDQLLKDIGAHLFKNKLEHLIDDAFQMDNQQVKIDELNEKVERLEQDVEEKESEKQHLQIKIDNAIDQLEEVCPDGHDSLSDKSKIEDIIKLLQ